MSDDRDLEELRRIRLHSEAKRIEQQIEAHEDVLEEIVAQVDDLDLCPRCGSLSDAESGILTTVVRCRSCRFEGVRGPEAGIWDRIHQRFSDGGER